MSDNTLDEQANPTVEPSDQSPSENEIETVNYRNDELNKKSNIFLIINAIYYIFVFVAIGLPIWCLTTTTYRASLPFNEIDRLNSIEKLEIGIKLHLIHFNTQIKDDNLKSDLGEILDHNMPVVGLTFNFGVEERIANSNELSLAEKHNKIEDLDKSLEKLDDNKFKIYVLNSKLASKFSLVENDFVILNHLYLLEQDLKDLKKVAEFIQNNYLNVKQLILNYEAKLSSKKKQPIKQNIKVVNFANEYEIIFSLINSKSKVINSDWNIEYCIEKYFQPVVNQLSMYSNYSIKAQKLLYTEFDTYPATIQIENDFEYYAIKQTDLSLMTNHIENRLGSRISDSSALEFVTYAHPKQLPLFIKSSIDEKRTSSFLIPRWGGIYIYNHENTNSSVIEVNQAMKVFLTQFIELIGIKLNKNSKTLVRTQVYSSEINNYLLEKTIDNLASSINTLKSLSSLLTQIVSMVIEDKIALQIQLAVDSTQKSLQHLINGNIESAFYESRIAFSSSEKAFFDESLLELLYFPEDQRFAIYIPLFIPVGIPLLLSMKPIVAYIKAIKKQKTN